MFETNPYNYNPYFPQSMAYGYQQQQQNSQIQGIRFVQGLQEAQSCTIPLGTKSIFMDMNKDVFYLKEMDFNVADTQAAIKDGDYALSSQLAQCCCENKVATADLKYSDAMNTASINANTTAQTQKILDALAQNKIDALQAQVTELKTQNMFCGVPRISPYGYGVTPTFANCGCNTVAF